MSHVQSPVAPSLSRLGRRDDGPGLRPVSFKPAPPQMPGGTGHSLRGKLLYPAVLVLLSVASWLVTRDKDGLR